MQSILRVTYLFCRNAQSDGVHVVGDDEQKVLRRRLERADDAREHAVAVAEEARARLVRERAAEREEGGHEERRVRKPCDLFVKARRLRGPLILYKNGVHECKSLRVLVHRVFTDKRTRIEDKRLRYLFVLHKMNNARRVANARLELHSKMLQRLELCVRFSVLLIECGYEFLDLNFKL